MDNEDISEQLNTIEKTIERIAIRLALLVDLDKQDQIVEMLIEMNKNIQWLIRDKLFWDRKRREANETVKGMYGNRYPEGDGDKERTIQPLGTAFEADEHTERIHVDDMKRMTKYRRPPYEGEYR